MRRDGLLGFHPRAYDVFVAVREVDEGCREFPGLRRSDVEVVTSTGDAGGIPPVGRSLDVDFLVGAHLLAHFAGVVCR